jgi:hypothetical protein
VADAVKARVFYSWQSDTPNAANRSFILTALEGAAKEITSDDSIKIEPVVDRDTLDVAGSPDIGATILEKITAADVMVADVTIINPGSAGRLTPNPNVLVEVGYALAVHTESRLILVNNLFFGRPEDLPFNLRQKRVLSYRSAPDASERASDRRVLQGALTNAIGAVLTQQGVSARVEYPCRLSVRYRVEKQTQELHEYVLEIKLDNASAKRINTWHVDVEIPTQLLKEPESHVGYVRDRSTDQITLIRFTHESHKGALFPGDSRLMKISYHMSQRLFNHRSEFFKQSITVSAYAEGEVAAEEIKTPASEMQCF